MVVDVAALVCLSPQLKCLEALLQVTGAQLSGRALQRLWLARLLGPCGHALHHIANHQHAGAGEAFSVQGVRQVLKRGDGVALLWQAGVLDDGSRGLS